MWVHNFLVKRLITGIFCCRLVAYEKYPIENFRPARAPPTVEQITDAVKKAKPKLNLKKLLNPLLGKQSWVAVFHVHFK